MMARLADASPCSFSSDANIAAVTSTNMSGVRASGISPAASGITTAQATMPPKIAAVFREGSVNPLFGAKEPPWCRSTKRLEFNALR